MGQFWSCGQLTSLPGNLCVVIAQQHLRAESQPLWEFALFCRDFEIFQTPKLHSDFTGGSVTLSAKGSFVTAVCRVPDSRFTSIDSQVALMIPLLDALNTHFSPQDWL